MKVRGNRIIIPLVFLILALLLSSNLLLRVFAIASILLVISYLWAAIGARGIRVSFGQLPERCQVGDRFNETITVFNDGRVPGLLLKLEEDTDLPACSNVKEFSIKPKSLFAWQMPVDCNLRGRYNLGTATVTSGDPFGLFSKNYRFGIPHQLLVCPATVELPYFELSIPGIFGGASNSRLLGQVGTNASGVREFVNGDSLMHIHWPSTARNGRLMVKMFEGGRTSSSSESIYIVVDMQHAVHYGEGNGGTEECAVTVAASLAKKYMEQGLQVGLIVSDNPILYFLPERGEEHLFRMQEALAVVHDNGDIAIDRVIADRMDLFSSGASVVLISSAPSPLLAGAVRQLRNREVLVSVVAIDAASFGGQSGSADLVRNLRWLGIQVYMVRKGDDLGKVLDGRAMPSAFQYV